MATSNGPDAPSRKTVNGGVKGVRPNAQGKRVVRPLRARYFKISAIFRWTPTLPWRSWMRTTVGESEPFQKSVIVPYRLGMRMGSDPTPMANEGSGPIRANADAVAGSPMRQGIRKKQTIRIRDLGIESPELPP